MKGRRWSISAIGNALATGRHLAPRVAVGVEDAPLVLLMDLGETHHAERLRFLAFVAADDGGDDGAACQGRRCDEGAKGGCGLDLLRRQRQYIVVAV